MKGWRTILFGAATAIAPAFLTYIAGIDWTAYGLHPAVAGLIGTAIMILRAQTTTPVGKAG